MELQDDVDVGFRDRFFAIVCAFDYHLRVLLLVEFVLVVLLVFSYFMVQPGTISYTILQLDAAIILSVFVATGYLIRRCGQRLSE